MIIIHSLSSQFSSVLQSCTVLCDPVDCSMSRPPCPSPAPGACSNSCPLSQWHHPTISVSAIPFSSCLESFSESGLFQWVSSLNQVGQSIGTSASAPVLPFCFRFLIFYQIEVWRPHSIQFPFYSLFWVFYQISWVSLSEQRFTDSHSVWFDAMAVNTQTVLCVHAQLNSTL